MNTNQRIKLISSVIICILAASLIISGCGVEPTRLPTPTTTTNTPVSPTSTPGSPTSTPIPLPTISINETSMGDFEIKDFNAVHAPVKGDTNQHLIFGNIPIATPAADLPPGLSDLLGRWEGYSYGPPLKKDWKFVFVIQEITATGGKAYLWTAANLQYPTMINEIKFRVTQGTAPGLEGEYLNGQVKNIVSFSINHEKGILEGWIKNLSTNYSWGPIELNRDHSFTIYKDYPRYLADKRIYSKEFRNKALQRYGPGYLVYLPEGYEADPKKTWPLIFFLHGSGDRGDNILLLAKASPFMMIREKGPLPFIIVAPLLNNSTDFTSFPDEFMDGALNEALSDYRVDQKRIYVTGLSLGGEGTYRFALHQPDTFAAIAPLSAFLDLPFPMPIERIKDLPVWAIHGAADMVVPLSRAEVPVEALKSVGGNIKFSILEGHDHDVWTDTYLDPGFYDWLLQHQKP